MGKKRGRYICMKCGKDLGPSGTEEDSHGICPKCLRKMDPDTARRVEKKRKGGKA